MILVALAISNLTINFGEKEIKKTVLGIFYIASKTVGDLAPLQWSVSYCVQVKDRSTSIGLKFQVGMKLEAIDPLNLATICVATVTKVRSSHTAFHENNVLSHPG